MQVMMRLHRDLPNSGEGRSNCTSVVSLASERPRSELVLRVNATLLQVNGFENARQNPMIR